MLLPALLCYVQRESLSFFCVLQVVSILWNNYLGKLEVIERSQKKVVHFSVIILLVLAFWERGKGQSLQNFNIFSVIWVLWTERNRRIFDDYLGVGIEELWE